ncbi:MAG: DUF167 domain-containing protein [Coriobacteriia bacterium]|jgi:uncharacterized protein (TIGR00251 family)|nr:DUF167 domain-containing protein [Coriobacteriia bacterium]
MDGARIAVHVTPRSYRDEVAGWRGSELSVRVTAPPEGGKANLAVCRALARALGVPKSAVVVVRGHGARHKQVEVAGVSLREVRDRLGVPDELF